MLSKQKMMLTITVRMETGKERGISLERGSGYVPAVLGMAIGITIVHAFA